MKKKTVLRKVSNTQNEKGLKKVRKRADWDEAMKLGIVGLVAAFVFRVFYDMYILQEPADVNYALYHGLVFGFVVTLIWKLWPHLRLE
ncbi:hypothetical protein HY989_06365 [Candidatus Micrarchaeota archaeon]|nr:hypothetical protein [Candidatus Micrarchaeota archaeon]